MRLLCQSFLSLLMKKKEVLLTGLQGSIFITRISILKLISLTRSEETLLSEWMETSL